MTLRSNLNKYQNTIKQHTQIITNQNKFIKIGTVSGYDPEKYLVKVDFQPYDNQQIPETSWVPIASLHAGTNRGVFTPPKLQDQAIVAFGDGVYQNGVLLGYIFSDVDVPPTVPSGTFLLQIGNGSDISTISIAENGSLTISSSQSVTITAPAITISSEGGDAGFLAKFAELKAAYDAHTHATSGGESSPPSQPLDSNVSTQVVKAE